MDFELSTAIDSQNTTVGDLKITGGDSNAQLTFIGGDIEDTESYSKMVAQRIKSRLSFSRGEWYLDQRKGTPWAQNTLGKAITRTGEGPTRAMVRQVILGTPGVLALNSLSIDIDRRTRHISLDAEIVTDMRTTITIQQLDREFVVIL